MNQSNAMFGSGLVPFVLLGGGLLASEVSFRVRRMFHGFNCFFLVAGCCREGMFARSPWVEVEDC
jgi:hypothetical protein